MTRQQARGKRDGIAQRAAFETAADRDHERRRGSSSGLRAVERRAGRRRGLRRRACGRSADAARTAGRGRAGRNAGGRQTRRLNSAASNSGLRASSQASKPGRSRVRHGPQCHEGAQIVIGRRDELAAGLGN